MSKNTKKVGTSTSNKNAAKSAKSPISKIIKPMVQSAPKVDKAATSKPLGKVASKAAGKKVSPSISKTSKTNPTHRSTTKEMGANAWLNIFDSSMTDDIKEGIERFMETTNSSICSSNAINNNIGNTTKDLITRLSGNIRHNFEQNMELSQSILKCKNAGDFIEFQRKNFEINYKNITKLYSDFFHDIQALTNQSLKDSTKYVNDNKGLVS